jgi:hypothetical protein
MDEHVASEVEGHERKLEAILVTLSRIDNWNLDGVDRSRLAQCRMELRVAIEAFHEIARQGVAA